jgi:flagellar basal-body rod protein FlgC
MDLNIIDTATSALLAERTRMDVVAGNLANINTTHDSEGNYSPYRRKVVNFGSILDEESKKINGVHVSSIEEDPSNFKLIYDPSHPNADESGYIKMPNISIEKEMVDLLTAKSSYQANIKTIQVFKSMYNAALEI